jgi:hypothetical protein
VESLELGLARKHADEVLAAGLRALYAEAPGGDTSRWCSTADAERNVPGVRLTRADLGWKSLLCAAASIPRGGDAGMTASVLLPTQGYAVVRRDGGRIYVALDYGHHGGGHGHPDRLNLWLVSGDTRVLEDVGTGSYVDASLAWFRSTLAHNAPLVDGRSQQTATGSLRAWDSRNGFTWVDAEVVPSEGVLVRRTVVVSSDYVVDRLEWSAARSVTLDLPWHTDGAILEATWERARLGGGTAPEDGFPFITDAERAGPIRNATITVPGASGRVHVGGDHEWVRALAGSSWCAAGA